MNLKVNTNFFKGKKSKFYKNYKKDTTINYRNKDLMNQANYQSEMVQLYNHLYDPVKDRNSKKILCVIQKGSSNNKLIGISYIQPTELQLDEHVSTIYTGDYSIYDIDSFELFLSNLQPDLILLHCASDSKLKDIFKFFENKVRFIPSIYIQFIEIKNILFFYFKNTLEEDENDVRIYSRVAKVLDTLSESSYSAFYSILMIALKSNSNQNEKLANLKFEKILFEEILFVSKKTQREIKIFEEKLHPSLVKGIGRSKEGLSLFALFNKCITTAGKRLMKNLFSFPSKNYQKINQRLDCIGDFLLLKNYSIIKLLITELKNIKDLEKILNELNKFMINFKIWNGLFYSLESILKILELFKNHFLNCPSAKFKLLSNIYSRIDKENVVKIYNFLKSCLDFMKNELRPKIKMGINEDLDLLRKEYNELDEVLSGYAIDYSKNIPKNSFMDKFMYVFLPQLGYMLAVEKSSKYYSFLRKINTIVEGIEEGKIEMNGDGVIENMKVIIGDVSKNFNKNLNEREDYKIDENSNLINNKDNPSVLNSKKSNHSNVSYDKDVIDEVEDRFTYSLSMNNDDNLLTFQNHEEFHYSNNNKRKILLLKKDQKQEIIIEDNDENKSDREESNLDDVNNNEENYEFHNYEETFLLQKLLFKDLNIKFQFHSDDMIYFKNDITTILDNQYGDLSARITDIENAIFREISKQIVEYEKDLQLTNEFISNLDVFLHMYLMTEKLNLYRPNLFLSKYSKEDGMIDLQNKTEESNLSYIDGRNLITELVNERQYIKNSFNGNHKSIYIISGNISSGKSVFLRQIGMLSYLAQIGSYVPARGFNLTIFDRILSNIEIIESSVDNLSGFTIELKEIKTILDILSGINSLNNMTEEIQGNNCDDTQLSNTLVLLEDPFKRTSSQNRNCLLGGMISFLNRMIQNRNLKAKIFITSSFETRDFLIQNDLINEKITGLYEMKTGIVNDKNISEGEMNLLNLYELKEVDFNSARLNARKENILNLSEGHSVIMNNNMNLFLAKDDGLDNGIFLRAIEISNILNSNQKIFPDIIHIGKIAENLRNQSQIFKIMNENLMQCGDILERLNCLLDN